MEFIIYPAAILLLAFLCTAVVVLFRMNQRHNKHSALTQLEFNTAKGLLERAALDSEQFKAEITQLRSAKESLATKNARLEATNEQLSLKLAGQEAQLVKVQEKLQRDFQLLAGQILEEKTQKFTLQNKSQLSELLNPLRERIVEFEKKMTDTTRDSIDRNSRLITEIRQLKELNQVLSQGADSLTKALSGSSKMQGDWGEMILERILENSGLLKNREYKIQVPLTGENGKNLRPDVIINLPSGRAVVVDSKVSLLSYQRYVNEEADENRKLHLRDFLTSCNAHVSQLSKKGYQHLHGLNGLDFVLMFIPVEPAFMLALQQDQALFNSAYEKGIVLVSPSTLIAALKIIAAAWKYEQQNQNALEIAYQGRKLFDKFVGFTEEMLKIGEHIGKAQTSHADAMAKLSTGRGNLVSRAQKLQSLGVKSEKRLNAKLRDTAIGSQE